MESFGVCRKSSVLALSLLLATACSNAGPSNPGAPSRAEAVSPIPSTADAAVDPGVAVNLPDDTPSILFPPRNEAMDFRLQLEEKYRDGLRRPPRSTFVDLIGSVVWAQEYLRYRVHGCSHLDATSRVFTQIDGGAVQPLCNGVESPFPPRDQSLDFRNQLEAKYRDGLRRTPVQTSVDNEGDIVWLQEYLVNRVGGCGHLDAIRNVFVQIDGGRVQAPCVPAEPFHRVITVGQDLKDTFSGTPLIYQLTAPSDGTLVAQLTFDHFANGSALGVTLGDLWFPSSGPNWSPVVARVPVSAGQTLLVTVEEGVSPWDYYFDEPFVLTTSMEGR